MKGTNTYLMFDGNAREAMTFYGKCFGVKPEIMTFADAPEAGAPDAQDRIMHASIRTGNTLLMASDTMPGMRFQQGNNFSINIAAESLEEAESLFAAFGEGGKVTMPMQDTFWGARFGMLTDKFGVNWMFNFEHPKQP